MSDEHFQVGDVISMKGQGVPPELEAAFWRVEDVGPPVRLSKPYHDQALTRPVRANPLEQLKRAKGEPYDASKLLLSEGV